MDKYRRFLASPPPTWLARAACLGALLIILVLATRRAWLSDDAYITFRTVDNFINGLGLTWNPGERVQSYTHPFWMFLLSAVAWVTREFYYSPILLSLSLTALTAWLIWRAAVSHASAALALATLALSPIFIDYSTGGLENSLSHVLLAGFLLVYLRGKPNRLRPLWLSLLSSLAGFNRLDSLLLYLPALLAELIRSRRLSTLGWMALGQTPLILWEGFSLLYYGFPFPNTFYAKLNTGIPQTELWQQGWHYLAHALRFDPLLPAVLLGTAAVALLRRRLDLVAVVFGMLFYLVYILRIGGDFMGGRFFSVLMVAAVTLLAQIDLSRWRLPRWAALLGAVVILALLAPLPTFKVLSAEIQQYPDRGIFDANGIADERQTYFFHTGFLLALQGEPMPQHWYIEKAREAAQAAAEAQGTFVTPQINIGIFGYYAGPQVHIVDRYALSDPLLSRLPTFRTFNWRIGHFTRPVPEGYLETLATGENQIQDMALAKYYNQLTPIIRDPLFAPGRLEDIRDMNRGRWDFLISTEAYQLIEHITLDIASVSQVFPQGTPSDQAGVTQMKDSGVSVVLGNITHAASLDLTLDNNDDYRVSFWNGAREVAVLVVPGFNISEGLARYTLATPGAARDEGFDVIQVHPLRGDGFYALGHLVISP